MLTIRTAAHIATSRHCGSFRLCPASTGAPLARTGVSGLLREWRRLLTAQSRRLWLEGRWSAHVRRVRVRPGRRQS